MRPRMSATRALAALLLSLACAGAVGQSGPDGFALDESRLAPGHVDRYIRETGKSPSELLRSAAATASRPASLDALVKRGANVNGKDGHGLTAAHYATSNPNGDILRFLAGKGADLRARDKPKGNEPIHYAARIPGSPSLGLLLDMGADIDAKNDDGTTPLHFAILSGNPGGTGLLLDRGADVNAKTKKGISPIEAAVHVDDRDIALVRRLVESGADINETGSRAMSPVLYAAFISADLKFIEGLLELGADPNLLPSHDDYPDGVPAEAFIHYHDDCGLVMDLFARHGGKTYPLQEFLWCSGLAAYVPDSVLELLRG